MLSASAAGASTESGGKKVTTQVLHTMQQASTLKIVTYAVLAPTVLKPGTLDTLYLRGPSTPP